MRVRKKESEIEENAEDLGREKVLESWDIWNHLPQISCTQIKWLIFVVMLAMADGNFFGQGFNFSYQKNHSLQYTYCKLSMLKSSFPFLEKKTVKEGRYKLQRGTGVLYNSRASLISLK